jgi:HprK-related kinase A
MRLLKSLNENEARGLLANGVLRLKSGPFTYSLRSREPTLFEGLYRLYADFPLEPEDSFADFHIALVPSNPLHKLRGKIDFYAEEERPFNRIDAPNAFAFMEWGMNWCVSINVNEYLKLHAAVLSKNNVGLILPGLPGAGKSTLCAALCLSGWRVLSDEHALIPLGTSSLVPLPRPVSLKNESIEIIRNFDSRAVFGPRSQETHKGTVVHMKSDLQADSHDTTPIPARIMMFPKYSADSEFKLRRKSKAEAFMFAGVHSFNYDLLSTRGFETMSTLMDAVDCYDLHYSDLDQALKAINTLADQVEVKTT